MYKVVKRLLDILFALVALVILSPILLVSMVILLCTGEHEVFYFQKRVGYHNQPFFIWKFATMLKNSPNIGTGTISVRNDPRVLPFGRLLRKTKINELPQIFNVLLGDMSIVGPRPLVPDGFNAYAPEVKARVYNMHPGITGIGSIVFRDEEKILSVSGGDLKQLYAELIMPYKGALEMWYQDHVSFMTDFKIIVLTAWAILRPTSNLHHKWLKDLPVQPNSLKN
ncbi:MAG: sugar transferase [Alistipes sp.]